MQQFFINGEIKEDRVVLEHDVIYQLKKVLRAQDGYVFRLADSKGRIFLCELEGNAASIKEELDEYNELDVDITAIIALIKNDKMDLCIQKLTELGVRRIVPYKAYRSVVKEGKGNNKLSRFEKIAREAAEQCHRNFIPEIYDYADMKDLDNYKSDLNIVAYEKEDDIVSDFHDCKSVTFIIGPEGGFEPSEIEMIKEKGFTSLSLGKRILRAETAAMYITSIIVGANQ